MNKFLVELKDVHIADEPPLCPDCTYLHDDGLTCDAFPEGIPMKYRTGEAQHYDGEIAFEPKDEWEE